MSPENDGYDFIAGLFLLFLLLVGIILVLTMTIVKLMRQLQQLQTAAAQMANQDRQDLDDPQQIGQNRLGGQEPEMAPPVPPPPLTQRELSAVDILIDFAVDVQNEIVSYHFHRLDQCPSLDGYNRSFSRLKACPDCCEDTAAAGRFQTEIYAARGHAKYHNDMNCRHLLQPSVSSENFATFWCCRMCVEPDHVIAADARTNHGPSRVFTTAHGECYHTTMVCRAVANSRGSVTTRDGCRACVHSLRSGERGPEQVYTTLPSYYFHYQRDCRNSRRGNPAVISYRACYFCQSTAGTVTSGASSSSAAPAQPTGLRQRHTDA